jgi:hypothetical protein
MREVVVDYFEVFLFHSSRETEEKRGSSLQISLEISGGSTNPHNQHDSHGNFNGIVMLPYCTLSAITVPYSHHANLHVTKSADLVFALLTLLYN